MGFYPYYGDLAELIVMFWVIFVAIFVVALAVILVYYILESIGLYHIAKCRGIENAFLAWIPIGRAYLLGSIADQIGMHEGKNTRYSLILLIFGCITFFSGMFTSLFDLPVAFSWILIIASTVFTYIAYYQIFRVHAPEKATLFLVLSIILGLGPIFVFAVRNRVPTDMAPPPQYPYSPYPGQGGNVRY